MKTRKIRMTFAEACAYAIAKGIVSETASEQCGGFLEGEHRKMVVVTLANGDFLTFTSEVDYGYGEHTPGEGIMPPKVVLTRLNDAVEEASKYIVNHESHAIDVVAVVAVKVGDTVEVTGRPYGDCPEQDFKLAGCAPIGTLLTVEETHLGPDAARLSDGYHYPSSSYRRIS